MKFNLNKSIEILERTPITLESMLRDLSSDWVKSNEGENTWSPYDILGHLIFGEKTDWMVRATIILNQSEDRMFQPFDRFAQLKEKQDKTIVDLITEFKKLRKNNLIELKSLNLTHEDFERKGIHPELGEVTLEQLISTWVVHDLGHIAQISRVMAKQYKTNVGPWEAYLGILHK
ncbi:DinB family protein [Aquimarina sp. AU474]|uniref:DinB family protein n=1 Tax=Aquimarina sp. AU474 TaxID=2108529 RepID=UPI000D697C46|nr:DinB family protein [Aquimarina sp. AU474]